MQQQIRFCKASTASTSRTRPWHAATGAGAVWRALLPLAAGHMAHEASIAGTLPNETTTVGLTGALVHTAGYLLVTGVIAVVVYVQLGLRLLGRAWFNVNGCGRGRSSRRV